MLTIASDAHRAHHLRTPDREDGVERPPVEVPERVDRIVAALREHALGDVRGPYGLGLEAALRVHTPEYLAFLSSAHARWCEATGQAATAEAVPYVRPLHHQPYTEAPHVIAELGRFSHDTDPIGPGTWDAAAAAVDVALSAWQAVLSGEAPAAYALCRPPGHHAAADSFGGYCYLNNAAVVAQAWSDAGARVAIVDVDFHHGNGTQQIFYDRDDVLYVSLHGDPAHHYPYFLGFADERGWGAGEGYTRNFPLPPGTDGSAYAEALAAATAAVARFGADGLVVSLGVDTAVEEHDSFALTADDFSRVGDALARLDRPTVAVQEGGYALDVLGRNVARVLRELG